MTGSAMTGPRAAATSAGGEASLAGTPDLVRFALRRDRRRIAAWTIAVGLTVAASVAAVVATYPDEAARLARAALSLSPATVAIAGPLFGADEASLGSLVANELVIFVLVVVAVMSILVVVRHTRADEEAGRTELLRALPVGRFAPAAAAVLVVTITNAITGLAVLVALAVNGLALVDSFALGAATAATGLVFGGVAAVTAQLTAHARAATGMALGVLGVTFLLRAVGDVMEPATGSWLSWTSPLAWAQQMQHYADLRWWPLLPSVVTAVALFALAGALSTRRDLGAGLRQERPGPAVARPALLSAHGLASRLLRGSFMAWTGGIAVCAFVFGALAYAIEDMIAEAPEVAEWIAMSGGDLVASYVAFTVRLVVVAVAAFGVSAVLGLRAEEQAGRAEMAIVSGSSRTAWLGGWLAVAIGQVVVALVVSALALGIGAASATGDADWVIEALGAGIAYLPAVLAVVALAAALVGLAPRFALLAWGLVGWVTFVALFGEILDLPPAMQDISPVSLMPLVPAEAVAAGPPLALAAIAIGLLSAGLAGFRRRDVIPR